MPDLVHFKANDRRWLNCAPRENVQCFTSRATKSDICFLTSCQIQRIETWWILILSVIYTMFFNYFFVKKWLMIISTSGSFAYSSSSVLPRRLLICRESKLLPYRLKYFFSIHCYSKFLLETLGEMKYNSWAKSKSISSFPRKIKTVYFPHILDRFFKNMLCSCHCS